MHSTAQRQCRHCTFSAPSPDRAPCYHGDRIRVPVTPGLHWGGEHSLGGFRLAASLVEDLTQMPRQEGEGAAAPRACGCPVWALAHVSMARCPRIASFSSGIYSVASTQPCSHPTTRSSPSPLPARSAPGHPSKPCPCTRPAQHASSSVHLCF